ncbi:MAG: hypothetical protein EOO88_06840, partial [Pedobacter sp.]
METYLILVILEVSLRKALGRSSQIEEKMGVSLSQESKNMMAIVSNSQFVSQNPSSGFGTDGLLAKEDYPA